MNTQGISHADRSALLAWVEKHPGRTTLEVAKAHPRQAYRTTHGWLTLLSRAGKVHGKRKNRDIYWHPGPADGWTQAEEDWADDPLLTVDRRHVSSWTLDHPLGVRSVFDVANRVL